MGLRFDLETVNWLAYPLQPLASGGGTGPSCRRASGGSIHLTLPRLAPFALGVLLDYLEKLALKHFNFMTRVRDQWPNKNERTGEWLSTYRRYFGMGNRLQVERIYTEAAKFFNNPLRPYGLSRLFDEFGSAYQVALTGLLQRTAMEERFGIDVANLRKLLEKAGRRPCD